MNRCTFSERGMPMGLLVQVALGCLLSCQEPSGASSDATASVRSSTTSSGGEASTGGSSGSAPGGSGGAANVVDGIDWGGCTYDPGLAGNIRWALGASSEYTSVRDLTYLSVDHEPYASLAGIECLENVERVSLSYYFPEGERPVIDLSPLASLGKLTELGLTTIGFSQLEVLANGPLRDLRLWYVEADSLESVRALGQLRKLDLSGLPVSDLSPLSGLTALESLTLDHVPVTTLAALSGLPALETLTLSTLEIRNLEGLTALPKLAKLYIVATNFENFEGLADVPRLASVRVEGCEQVQSLDGLEGCAALETLEVLPFIDRPSAISDIDALAEVPKLKLLDLVRANVTDISALAGCPLLEHLNLESSQVTDLSPLVGLPLQWLDVSNNQVEAIDALAEMPLSTLRLSNNPIVSLEPLGTLTRLAELAIDGLGAHSLELLSGAPLTHLYAADNALTDISPVMGWDLVDLMLANNEIVSLPEGFLGGQGFCSRTDLTGNPLDEAAQDRLGVLCEPPSVGPGYSWDRGECSPACVTR